MGTRRRFTPEYRRDVAGLVLDTGSTIASVAPNSGLGESVVGRCVTLERDRDQAVEQGRPDPRELEAENTASLRRVRELEKENEFLGKASAFFASGHYNSSDLSRWTCTRLPTRSL
jgi:transposase